MKRIILFLLIAALVAALLPGCGRGAEIPEAGETEAAVPSEAAPESTEALAESTAPTEAAEAGTAAAIRISEVMADNRLLLPGHGYDWVELYNPEEFAVRLEGYALTDDPERPAALPLDGREIPAGGYLAVALEDGAAFGLSEAGETVWLTFGGKAISSLTFGASTEGQSFDGEGNLCRFPTPGFANTEAGYYEYLDTVELPELVINEVIAANGSYDPLKEYGYYDLVELLNTSHREISLKDYSLTDKWMGTSRYRFPEVTLKPGEMYVVLCSGDASRGAHHAPFALTPGETVYLEKQGVFADALTVPEDLQYDESYGRSGRVPVYLNKPTPGKANTEGSLTGISAPVASVAPGMYDEAVTVTLTGTGTIYYTTSGTRPSTYSRVYTGPITAEDVTTIRAICVEGSRQSPVADFTYVIGKEHDLPVLVVSIPESSIYGERGLHTNIEAKYEYEAVMTLFEDGEEKFTVPFGLRLHGNDSRKGSKKNYKVLFRAEYGQGKLEYPLFDNRNITEYNSLLLKGGSEDWGAAMIRDELATTLVDGTTELYTQASKPVVLYMMGEYWGVFFLRERFDEEYVASHLDVSPESVEILSSSAGYPEVGSGSSYHALKRYVKTHDMSTNENYAYLCQQIDITGLMDWYACRIYYGDTDIANIRRFRSTEDDGKWKWMFFDLDWSFYAINNIPVSDILTLYGGDRELIQAALASQAGRDAFLKRYACLMETILNEAYITEKIDAMVDVIDSEMPRDRARWKRSYSGWEDYVQVLRDFVRGRNKVVLKDIKNYFSLSDSQMEHYFGSLWE